MIIHTLYLRLKGSLSCVILKSWTDGGVTPTHTYPRLEDISNMDVCDDCTTVAYDNGADGYDEQATMMSLVGSEVADHNCIVYLEPELNARCDCACN